LSEEPTQLKIDKYRAMQERIKSTVTQNNSLLKLSQEMNVAPVEVDKDRYFNNPDKMKGDRYQAWLRNLKTDLQIGETVRVVKEMVTAPESATVFNSKN
ncbi:MAG: hypothetical protein GXC72_10395, partial [Chitinophagaceae bacterium]|nr:hypothetical protein [Chitinophagaceae bacterium]